MGEAVSRVSVAFRTTNPDLMPWSTVKAVRNLLIHGYDTVDLDISLDYWPMWQRGDGMQRTNIYLDEDQLRLLKHLAAEESKSVADLVRQAVDQFLRSRLEDGVTWQNDMTARIERVHSRVSPVIDPDEIERDIREARQDVRAAQR